MLQDVQQWTTFIVLICTISGVFIEILPIKINPIEWLGSRLNKKMNLKMDEINEKLDEHIADDMRTYILDFQNQCLQKRKHTKEEWNRSYKMCDKYEEYIRANNLRNSEADEAIGYIRQVYRHCLEDGEFLIKEAG